MIIRLIFLFILFYVLFKLIQTIFSDFSGKRIESKKSRSKPLVDEMVQDPYCSVYLPKKEAIRANIQGEVYYFCSKECLKKFLEEKKNKGG